MKFEFDKKTHKYFLDGKEMTGVTSVLGMIAKPALIQWAANQAVEFITKLDRTMSDDDWQGQLKAAKTAHRKTKEEAGQSGTDVHKMIENRIKEAIKKSGIMQGHDANESPQVSHFINWAMKNNVVFLESEKVMYHPEWFVGGTADFVCEIGGKKYVGDIKTSSGIYDRVPFFQTAAYRGMLENMGEGGYNGSVIVHLPKNGIFEEEKNIHFSYDYESDLEGFLAALKLYRLLKNY